VAADLGRIVLDIPSFRLDDVTALRSLVEEHPWATIVTSASDGTLVVSHLPLVLDDRSDGVTVLGHLARTDAEEHRLGARPVVVIVAGPHGYVSPSFYRTDEPYVPTWNYVVLHLHGRPELLDASGTYDVLDRTVDRFETRRTSPWRLDSVREYADSLLPFVTGFRLVPERVVGKAKLSQDKPQGVTARVAAALETDRDHGQPDLAAFMRRHGATA
jgi:transcriptional regulator